MYSLAGKSLTSPTKPIRDEISFPHVFAATRVFLLSIRFKVPAIYSHERLIHRKMNSIEFSALAKFQTGAILGNGEEPGTVVRGLCPCHKSVSLLSNVNDTQAKRLV